jgi:4-hydroxy-tetrahydrodipicolinate reductase
VAVFGAAGRMGRAVLGCMTEASDLKLVGAIGEPRDPALGRDAGEVAGLAHAGITLSDDPLAALHGAHVAIDFTLPTATEPNLRACVASGTALVIGTTGLEDKHLKSMEKAAYEIPIVYARNMSIGVNVFIDLVARAARVLGEDYDVEIGEAHHRHKADAPSGTALALGDAIAGAKGRKLSDVAVYARHGHTGPRVPGTIGFSVTRGGNIIGEHVVRFISGEEHVEFTHRAFDRVTFARGAIRAARWTAGRAPGLYSMIDVLGLGRD